MVTVAVIFLRQNVLQSSEVVNEPSDHAQSFDFFSWDSIFISWLSACCLVLFRGSFCPYAAVDPKWDIEHHFDHGVRSSCFFHKQTPERVTRHRPLSSSLIPSMCIEAGERRMKERKEDESNTGPSLPFWLEPHRKSHSLHSGAEQNTHMQPASFTGIPHTDMYSMRYACERRHTIMHSHLQHMHT